MPALNILAQLLLIIGGLNWGLVGLFDFDLVKAIFGGTLGTSSGGARIIYVLVALAALWGVRLLAGSSTTVAVARRT
jgi:uncharacterized protein